MPQYIIIIWRSNMWGYIHKNMLPLLILSARVDEMIKNPALKLKNRLFNLNAFLALYLEHFFFKWSRISWCTNISGIISNAERKQTTSTKSCNYESQLVKLFIPTNLYKRSGNCFSLQWPRFVTRVVHFVLVAEIVVPGTFFFLSSSISLCQYHSASSPYSFHYHIADGQWPIRSCSFRRHGVMLVQG